MPPGVSLSDFGYFLPELILTAGALIVLVADVVLPRGSKALVGLTAGVLVATIASLVPLGGVRTEIYGGLIAVDQFALFFKLIFLLAALITVLLSVRYLQIEGASPGEYYFLVLCATLGMMIMAGGIDLITSFIGLETMAVSFYILVGFIKPNQRSNEAAVKYFLLGAFSLGILLYGMSLLYGLSGTTKLREMATVFAGHQGDPVLILAVILLIAGFGFKIAAVPFHMWAPDVYEGAPTPITAFLSVGSKAASFAMLLRFLLEGLPTFSADWRLMLEVLAVVTMTVGNFAALTQSNIKRMLAYSSIAHAGYLLIGLVAGTPTGIAAMLLYLFVYAFMQLGAFAIVVMMRRRDLVGDELKDLSGLHFRAPIAAAAMLVFMLSLGGTPPTAGFMGKLWLFGAAIQSGYVWLAVIGVLNSAVSLYYYIRIVVFMYFKKETTGTDPTFDPALAFTVVLAVAATILIGIYPRQVFEAAQASAQSIDFGAMRTALFR